MILPIALFAEVLLFFEGILLAVFFTYTFYTNDFKPLVFVILILIAIICLQILLDPKARYHTNLLLLAPGAWILFYIMDFVEYQALIRSIWHIMTKQTPVWQNLVRVGIFENPPKETAIL